MAVILIVLSLLAPSVSTAETFKKAARRSFLGNLNKKFTSTTTPLAPIRPLLPYRSQSSSRIEGDLLAHIFGYLSKYDLDRVKALSTEFRSRSAVALAELLRRLCPHYVFPLNWMNELLYTFLAEFKVTSSLVTEDQLEIINYKFIEFGNDLNHSLISLDLKRLIISFLNELVYGVGQSMPADLAEWKCNLMRRLSKYSYHQALSLYQYVLIDGDEDWRAINQHFSGKLFERFTAEELNELVDWNAPFSASVLTAVTPEISCALIEITATLLRRDEDRMAAMEFMFENNSFSQQFWDYIAQYPHLLEIWVGNCDSGRWNKELDRKFTDNLALKYLLSRTAVDLFELEEFSAEFAVAEEEKLGLIEYFRNGSLGTLVEQEILESLCAWAEV